MNYQNFTDKQLDEMFEATKTLMNLFESQDIWQNLLINEEIYQQLFLLITANMNEQRRRIRSK